MRPSCTAPLLPALRPHGDEERAERDRALFLRYTDGDGRVDRDAVIERFLPLARPLALRCERPSEPFDDIQGQS